MKVTSDFDMVNNEVKSNRVKMGLQTQGTSQEQAIFRESSLMSNAFNWKESVELPVTKIESNEQEQIVETIFSKLAKKHHIENYYRLIEIFGDLAATQEDGLSKHFFTEDPAGTHLVSKPSGMLQGVTARSLSGMKTNSAHYKFFRYHMKISPTVVSKNSLSVLVPEKEDITIENTSRDNNLIIDAIFTSTPEFVIFLPPGIKMPHTLKPGQSLTFTLLIVPETFNLMQGAIYISFNKKQVYMMPVTAYVVANGFGLEPMYFNDINVGEHIQSQIHIKNPHADVELEILEVYSTEDYVKLYWPNGVEVMSGLEDTHMKDYSKYMKIPPAKKRHFLTIDFVTDQAVDHRAVIHVYTNKGKVMRLPLYFHVFTDLIKFTPSIVDFGLIPFKFDSIRVPVQAKIRKGHDLQLLYLTEVLLPIRDERLDFVMGAWDRELHGNIQVYNKQTQRLEEQRRGILHADQTFEVFTVVVNPVKYGEINTKVVLTF